MHKVFKYKAQGCSTPLMQTKQAKTNLVNDLSMSFHDDNYDVESNIRQHKVLQLSLQLIDTILKYMYTYLHHDHLDMKNLQFSTSIIHVA